MTDLLALTAELVDIPSVSFDEAAIVAHLEAELRAIPGLAETLGRNNVTSNYGYETAPYTWKLVQAMKSGRIPLLSTGCENSPWMYASSTSI